MGPIPETWRTQFDRHEENIACIHQRIARARSEITTARDSLHRPNNATALLNRCASVHALNNDERNVLLPRIHCIECLGLTQPGRFATWATGDLLSVSDRSLSLYWPRPCVPRLVSWHPRGRTSQWFLILRIKHGDAVYLGRSLMFLETIIGQGDIGS